MQSSIGRRDSVRLMRAVALVDVRLDFPGQIS